jgi:hypothetical protein
MRFLGLKKEVLETEKRGKRQSRLGNETKY